MLDLIINPAAFVLILAVVVVCALAARNYRSHDPRRLDASFRAWLQRSLPTPAEVYQDALIRASRAQEWGDDDLNPYNVDLSGIPNAQYGDCDRYFRDQITTEQFIERLDNPPPAQHAALERALRRHYRSGSPPPPKSIQVLYEPIP